MSCFIQSLSSLSVSSECIVSSKHLSSVVIILSAVPESFLSISQKRGAIIASSTTEFGATKWKLAWSISLADKRVSLEMVSLQQVRKRSKRKNSGTSIIFVLVRSLLKRKDNELCCHRDSLKTYLWRRLDKKREVNLASRIYLAATLWKLQPQLWKKSTDTSEVRFLWLAIKRYLSSMYYFELYLHRRSRDL